MTAFSPSHLPAARAIALLEVMRMGSIIEERLPSGKVRIRIAFGRVAGRQVFLSRVPVQIRGDRPTWKPFRSREDAEDVLAAIRSEASRVGLEAALAPWMATPDPRRTVGAALKRYQAHYAELVAAGRRSPGSLRELERYSRPGGHLAPWLGRSILDAPTYGELEDWATGLQKAGLSPKTVRNVVGSFRAFWRWLKRRGEVSTIPEDWPLPEVPTYAGQRVGIDEQARILEAIPWPRRGAFLVAATEALRFGEIVACDLDDYQDGRLRVARARQGAGKAARIAHTKNRSAEWRDLWSAELIRWIEWRVAGATAADRLAGAIALFWCPEARNASKRWSYDAYSRQWRDACKAAGVPYVKPGEGTRHSTLTALAPHLSERQLRAFSRHRSGRSLDHYATPRVGRDAIVRALPSRDD